MCALHSCIENPENFRTKPKEAYTDRGLSCSDQHIRASVTDFGMASIEYLCLRGKQFRLEYSNDIFEFKKNWKLNYKCKLIYNNKF